MCFVPVSTFLVLLILTSGLADKGDHRYFSGWEFNYHETHHLLLTISPRGCYFSNLPERYKSRATGSEQWNKTMSLIHTLITDHSDRVQLSSLNHMRNAFQDLLADFECVDKAVYSLILTGDDFVRSGIISSYISD